MGLLSRDGIAAVEDDMRQAYIVKHIRKGLTLLSSFDYYMRGGAYDKAASALASLRTASPDCAVAAKNAKGTKN